MTILKTEKHVCIGPYRVWAAYYVGSNNGVKWCRGQFRDAYDDLWYETLDGADADEEVFHNEIQELCWKLSQEKAEWEKNNSI